MAGFFALRLIEMEIIKPFDNAWINKNAPEKRILIWEVAVKQVLGRPIFGYGLENFREVYKGYFEKNPEMQKVEFVNRKSLVVTRAHNYILDLLVFSGIVGTAVWVWLVFSLFKQTRKEVFFISLLVYIIWIQVQIQSVAHLIYFWALAAMIVVQNYKDKRDD